MRFDDRAHCYDAYASPQRAFAERVATFLQIAPGEEVEEFGAGTGALTACLVTAGAKVHATDASPRMVALGKATVPGAAWALLDAFSGVLPQSRLQVSSGLLQWAPQPLAVLSRWKNALTMGGRMVHAMPSDPCLAEWRQLVPESPVMWRDEQGWLALFEAAGLHVLKCELWVLPTLQPSALDMLRALHRSGVTGSPRLSPVQLRHALKDYDARYGGPTGVISTWAWLAVEATPAGRRSAL